jgi:hypothetical protein
MKRTVLILLLMITAGVVMSSCTSSRSTSGCNMTRGMIGYK